VAILVPLEAERGVAQPTSSALERLRRGVIEASKQCGRNRLMEIAAPLAAAQFFAAAPKDEHRLIAHPGGEPLQAVTRDPCLTGSGVFLAVGPEGGFSDDEVSSAVAAGWRTISLGPRILRVETAAIALAAGWGTTGS
jgi:16S rRNA (uracil1498-N3)-methyltransferase